MSVFDKKNINKMKKEIDLNEYFKMDKTIIKQFNSFEEAETDSAFWLSRSVEERYFAIEFLRGQWIEMNNLSSVMDKMHFEYR